MQMTKSRKVVAMLLAVLMAFSSMSVFASALNYNDDGDIIFEATDGTTTTDGSNLNATIDVKFYDADGNVIENLGTVTPGQSVQARVFVGTNYYTSTSDLCFYYDNDFLSLNYPEVTVGDTTMKRAGISVNSAALVPAAGRTASVSAVVRENATTGDEGYFTVSVNAADDTATFVLDSSVYLFAIDMTVLTNANADDDGIGAVYAKASDLATESAMGNFISIPYGTATDDQYEVTASYTFNGNLAVTNTEITINNKATFYNDTDDTTGTEVSGKVGDSYTVPSASKEGYTFKGWASASGATIAADATTFTMPAEANIAYYGVWDQNVVVTVDPNGGTFADGTTAAKTEEVEQGTAWTNQPAVPTRDGYKFMGWQIDGTVIDALPSTYPTVDGDKAAYTYTAQWEKLVKITIDPAGATFADGTTAAKEYQDTDPATATIVGGQTWNTSTVPTYDIAAYTYAATGITRSGYALMGWRTSDGTILQSFPTTYPEDDETYTAVWQAMDVRVYYFADATAASVADVDTSLTNANKSRVDYVSVPYGTEYTVLGYTTDGESVATWTTADGATYAPGSTLNLTSPVVTFDANGRPNAIILIASDDQFTDSTKYEASFDPQGGIWADTTTSDTRVALYKDGESIAVPSTVTKQGYDFKGWSPEVGTMTPAGASFEAIWEAKTYDVTFMADGTQYDELTFTVENPVEFPADPEKTGNTFIGWYTTSDYQDGTEFEGWDDLGETTELTVYAKFDVNEYTISFEENGGTEVTDITAEYDTNIAAPAVPTKTGYTFAGWYETEDCTGTEYTFDKMPAKDFTLYANWTINQYTISFEENGGSEVTDITADYNTTVTAPADPTRTGYDFAGWYTTDALSAGDEYTFTTMPAENKTVYAKWNVHEFDINYYVDGVKDTENSKTDVAYGTAITAAAEPTKTGYTFSGWALDDGTAVPSNMPDNELNIYGTFSKNSYTITYVTDGSAVDNNPATVRFEAELPFATSEKTGYTFDKWVYTDEAGVEYTGATMPAYNLTATATWTANKYTITFNTDGGSDIADITQDYSTAIAAPAAPTKTGYTFAGWDKAIPSTMPAENMTITAKWTINQYTITFDTDGGSDIADITQDYNTAVTAPADPTKEGYTFSNWDKAIPSTMPAEDMTIKAVWNVNQYRVIYKNGSTVLKTDTYDYGATVTPIADPTQTGYTFKGWYENEDLTGDAYTFGTMPANNVTLYAKFDINQYNVYYVVDGTQDDTLTQTYNYNDTITPAAALTKTGYTFSGWCSDEACTTAYAANQKMGAADVTVYGKFTINQYDIVYRTNGGSAVADAQVNYGEAIPAATTTKAGYHFDSWTYKDEDGNEYTGSTMPAGNLTATANWTAEDQTITYKVDGTVTALTPDTFATDATITLADLPVKAGYTYTAWTLENGSAVPATMPAGGITVVTTSTADTQTITYKVDGVVTVLTPNSFATDETITLAAKPSKAGYTYTDWTLEDGSAVPATMPAGGITVVSTGTATNQTITYKVAGEADKVDTYATDATVTAYVPETRDGYAFEGWYTDDTYTTGASVPATMGADNIVLYGHYVAGGQKIVYKVDGVVTTLAPASAMTDAAFTLADLPTKAGYSYSAWTLEDGGSIPATMPAGGITVVTTSTALDQPITYKVDGETVALTPDSAKTDAAITLADLPTKTGYTYSAWTLEDGNAVPTNMPAGGITVVTTSTADAQTITYKVDGETVALTPASANTDATVTLAALPTKAGYTYSAWTLEDGSAVPATMPAGGITVVTTSTADDQPITYKVDGVVTALTPASAKTDATITLADLPTKAGYSYSDWKLEDGSAVPANMPAGGITVVTKSSAVAQTIKYVVDNEDYFSETYNTDAAIVRIGDPSKAGYTFHGWYTDDTYATAYTFGTMPAGGVTVYGYCTADAQTITYIVDNKAVALEPASAATDASFTLAAVPTKDGYSYSAWTLADGSAVPATMPVGGITVVSTSTALAQPITYKVDGETVELTPNTAATDAAVVLAAKPSKAGYTYTEWKLEDGSDVPATMPYGGITVVSTSTADAQTVNYYVDGVLDTDRSTTVATDGTITEAAKPEKEGYTFNGWYSDAACTTAFDFTQAMPAHAVNIYGKFTVNAYDIAFVLGNGEDDIVKHGNYGATVVAPADPERTGYTFAGWDKSIPATIPAEDVTITAKWTINQYTITFDTDGGTVIDSITQDYNTAVTAPAAPTKTGYTFANWDKTIPETMPAEDITIKAIWTVNPYTITYTVGEGETLNGNATVTVNYKDTIPAAPTASKVGYTFKGWTVTGNGSEYAGTTMPAYNLTATPIFEADTYTVTYVSEGTTEAKEFTYPEAIVNADAAAKTGYTFEGWYLTADYAEAFAADWDTVIANATDKALTVYAKYTVNSYNVTFTNPDDAAYSEVVSSVYGTSVNTPAAVPTKEGYSFAKWVTTDGKDLPATMPAGDFTAVATFTPNQYKATFMKADGTTEWNEIDVDYAAEINAPTGNPAKTGYNFLGWSRTAGATAADASLGTMDSTSGVTFYPVYRASAENEIVFNANGGNWSGATTMPVEGQVYDSAIVLPAEEPVRTGYHVIGYSMEADATAESAGFVAKGDTLPAYTTATAADWYYIWTENEYTITYVTDGSAVAPVTLTYGAPIPAATSSKTGYWFLGWTYTDAEGNEYTGATVPASDLTATAVFQVATFTVNFYVDDAKIASNSQEYGSAINFNVYTPEAGKKLDGWYTDQACTTKCDLTTMPAENITVYAKTVIDETATKTVTYKDAEGNTVGTQDVVIGTEIVPTTAVPEKAGYTNGQWSLDGENPINNATMPNEDITLTPIYEAKTYTITYNFTEAGGSETFEVEYDSDLEEPAAEREGYELEGWYLDADCTTPLTGWADIAANANAANEVTVYAKWTANEVVITFNPANGEDKFTRTRSYDDKILGSDVEAPEMDNYSFAYWTDADGNRITADDTVTTAAEYTAVYAPGLKTINYYVDGSIVASINVVFGTTTKIMPYGTSDFTVDSWSTADKTATYTAGADYTVDSRETLDLYANVTATTYTATFKLGADDAVWADGTAEDKTVTDLKTGDVIVAPADPTREGYVFKGWSPAVGTVSAESLEFTAEWIKDAGHTITYKNGDTTIEAFVVDYGDDIEITAVEPEKAGYSFTGWLDADGKAPEDYASMPNADLEFTAQFEAEEQTITYIVDGVETALEPASAKTDAEFTLADLPVKENYAYSAWTLADGSAIPATMPAGGITVVTTGTLTTVDYTFNADGGQFADGETTKTVTVKATETLADAETKLGETPTREGYTFEGWTAEGTTVTAQWKAIVKLVPASETSTAMIERDGVVETYNTFAADESKPYGVTSIITPDMDTYTAEGYDSWYVYGLGLNLTVADLADYVKASGDGTYKVYKNDGVTEAAAADNLGTGLIIKVFDGETVVEQFYVVIFGDIDGDADLSVRDTGRIESEIALPSWSEGDTKVNYLVKAADVDLDGNLSIRDTGRIEAAIAGDLTINQLKG